MDPVLTATFLGTGTSQGVPVIACKCAVCTSSDSKDNRSRTAIMFEKAGQVLVIDSGPDFRQQMLRENVQKLDALVFTHEHKDHIAGMDDIRAFNYVTGKPTEIYATEAVEIALRREFEYVFTNSSYPGIPRLNLNRISNKIFSAAGFDIIPIEVKHYNMPVLGFRIDDFTYITDANFISDKEKEKIKGSKVLVLNALRHEPHISHFNLEEALDLIQELQPEKAYLTHISHQLGKHEDVELILPDHVHCAFDGLKIKMDL